MHFSAMSLPDDSPSQKEEPSFSEKVGSSAFAIVEEIKSVALLFSESLYHSTIGFRQPKTLTRGSTVGQMIQLGSSALMLKSLISTASPVIVFLVLAVALG